MISPVRRYQLAVCCLALGGLVAGGLIWTFTPRGRPRLNVLLITLDTTRADRLGCYGAANAKTPALDELAQSGILFERAFTPVPLTLPSHSTMFTGLLPPEHGVRLNGTYRLDESLPTLAEQFAAEGYRTGGFIGAFVLDGQFGLRRGFQIYDDDFESPQPGRGPPPDEHDHRERSGSDVVNSALRWLKKSPQEPFFCWVHLFDPHLPYLPHEDLFGAQFQDRPYDAEIAYVDIQVRRLIEALRTSGRAEHTLVIVAGDHGESLGEHEEQTHGYTLYNATLHVPLIFSCPQLWSESRRVAEPVSLADLSPNILELVEVSRSKLPAGRSLTFAMRGENIPEVPCYAETLQPFEEAGWSSQFCLISEGWKYIRSPRPELYDLQDDPRELTNLAERNPERLKVFESQLGDRESAMVTRTAPLVALSSAEHRKLAGLGYAGGGGNRPGAQGPPADIKERIAYYNRYIAAMRLLHEGQLEQARSELQAVVAAVPDYFKAQYNLGVCQMRLKQFDEAAQTFERAIAIDANPTALVSLAKARLSQNQPAAALPPLTRALELQPESEEIRFLLQDAQQRAATGR